LKPSTRRPIERIANQVSERVLNWLTLCSLAAVAELSTVRAVQRSSYLDSSGPSREARDVDLIDLHHLREAHAISTFPLARALLTNQLPANSAGNFQEQSGTERGQGCRPVARRMRALQRTPALLLLPNHVRDGASPSGLQCARSRRRKKINVKRINC